MAFLAGHFIEAFIDEDTGLPMKNESYSIFMEDNATLATLYADANRTTTLTQPGTTSPSGNAEFYANVGQYHIRIGDSDEVIDVQPLPSDLLALQNAYVNGIGNLTVGGEMSGYRNTEIALTDTSIIVGTEFNQFSGATLVVTNSSPVTVSLREISKGTNFMVVQGGVGQITFVHEAAGGALVNPFLHTKTYGQYATAAIECISAGVDGTNPIWKLSGETAT